MRAPLWLIVAALSAAFCAAPAEAQQRCPSPDEIRAHAGDGVLADFDADETLSILIATEAPKGFLAEEIIAIAAPSAHVLLLFFHDDCAVHAAVIAIPDFEQLRKAAEGSPA